jgi:hypothetical protein
MVGKEMISVSASVINATIDGAVTETSARIAPIGVTLDDAAKISGVGRSSLYGAIRAGRLTARKSGARTIILYDDLRAFVAALPVAGIVGSRAGLAAPKTEAAA